MTLFYCPLEAYKERYTMQLSAPVTGWLERKWIEYGVDYVRVNGRSDITTPTSIQHGVALDATGRSRVAMGQVVELLDLFDEGKFTFTDVVYFDDFWHPGIEAIAYAFAVRGKPLPRMYANCWAQSVDKHDFTYPMRHWMRDFEKGNAKLLDKVFVACDTLRELVDTGIGDNVVTVGHPWCTEEVLSRMPPGVRKGTIPLENKVVFSSRLDKEKQPQFMLEVAKLFLETTQRGKWVICQGSPEFKSNHDSATAIKKLIDWMVSKYPGRFEVKYGCTKQEYYNELATAKVQFNSSLQDWISYTLLEASVAGCYPVYPAYRSFPEVFRNNFEFMYAPGDVESACQEVVNAINDDSLFTRRAVAERSWIHERYDTTWLRMLDIMGLWNEKIEAEYDRGSVWRDAR